MTTMILNKENFGEQMGKMYSMILKGENFVVSSGKSDFPRKNRKGQEKEKSFREKMEDPENCSFGPFTPEEFSATLQSWMK